MRLRSFVVYTAKQRLLHYGVCVCVCVENMAIAAQDGRPGNSGGQARRPDALFMRRTDTAGYKLTSSTRPTVVVQRCSALHRIQRVDSVLTIERGVYKSYNIHNITCDHYYIDYTTTGTASVK